MDQDQFRKAIHVAVEDVIQYRNSSTSRIVAPCVQPGYLRDLVPRNAPQNGEAWDSIRNDFTNKIIPGMTDWSSPNFFGFFPAGASFPSILGEFYSAALTGSMFNWICSPAATELEEIVMGWLARMLGLPAKFHPLSARAEILSSASECVLTAMIVARDRCLEITKGSQDTLVVIGSETTHSSTQKAAKLLNIQYRRVKARKEHNFRITRTELENTISECRAQSLQPFFLTATFGTTATCAVDDFEAISDLLKSDQRIWGHVDAAYAGSALICEENRTVVSEYLAEFHSFNVNISKWLLINLEGSCLFVADKIRMRNSLSCHASYLTNDTPSPTVKYQNISLKNYEITEPRDFQIGLSRRFASLKVWFVLRSYGIKGLQAHIRKHILLGERFASLVNSRSDILELTTGPAFALTTVRVKAKSDFNSYHYGILPRSAEYWNEITRKCCNLINTRGEIYVTGCELDDLYVIRFIGANGATNEHAIDRAFEILVTTSEEILGMNHAKFSPIRSLL